MKVIRLTAYLILILALTLPMMPQAFSSDFNVFDGISFEAKALGVLYPLRINTLQDTVLLREGVAHNITFYSYGYRPINLTYTPVPNGNLVFPLEPAPLFTFDIIAPNYPDLPMGIYKVENRYSGLMGVTSLNGKAYFYAPYESGDEITFYAMAPQDMLFWMKFLNASRYEPFLSEVRDRFLKYRYAVPMVPTPLVLGVDTDFTNYTVTNSSMQGRTLLMGSSRILEGYVRTASGEPLENAIVAIRPERFYRYVFAFTDENGYYRFDNYVGPGTYYVTVVYHGYVHPTQTLYIFSQDRVYNFTTPDLIMLEGYLKDINGNPLPNAKLVFVGTAYLSIAYTDDRGYYSLAVEAGAPHYLVMTTWNGLGLRDIDLSWNDLSDGFENLTAEVETALISGRVYDPVTGGFLGEPVIRFTGRVSGIPINVTIDMPLLLDGSFSVRIPIRVNLMGEYRNVKWSVLMADYYYSGNTLISSQKFYSDTDLGDNPIYPPDLVEIGIDIIINSKPPSIPVDSYSFSLWYGDKVFNISLDTNSTFKSHTPGAFILSDDFEGIVIEAVTPLAMASTMEITIPKDLMSGVFTVTVNDIPWAYTVVREDIYTVTLRIELGGGDHTIRISSSKVINEFQSIYILITSLGLVGFIVMVKRFRVGI